ncbi:homoserine O-acetyltransferase [bacterium]|nr:homoserine O-acetyltransferase [bacterium]
MPEAPLKPAPLLTTKQVATIPELNLACGERLREVTVGFETYGRLNEARDNVILICHFFSGHSHAAGRYAPDDQELGWWDAVIGPGKAIDTDRYFVVAIDALGCVRTDAPHGVTTSAASIDPATGEPYGPTFPALAMADAVAAQRHVLTQLGVERLAAVAGPSLGAMQALEWAVSRPGEVDRVIASIGLAEFQPREIGLYRVMMDAIRLDPRFKDGRYDREDPPIEGLAASIKLMLLLSSGRETLQESFGRAFADAECDPRLDRTAEWQVETWLETEGRRRAALCDANAWIAMLRANMRWDLAHRHGSLAQAFARLKARVLLIPGEGDELAHLPSYHLPMVQALEEAGADYAVAPLPPKRGHLAGLADIGLVADAIRACLETPLRA